MSAILIAAIAIFAFSLAGLGGLMAFRLGLRLGVSDEPEAPVAELEIGEELGLIKVGDGVWQRESDSSDSPVQLEGTGQDLPTHAHRLVARGPWPIHIRTGQPAHDQVTGDVEFDAVVSVRDGVAMADARVRTAVLALVQGAVRVHDGEMSVVVEGRDVTPIWRQLEALRDALGKAGTDRSLVSLDPVPGVRAQALKRLHSKDVTREVLAKDRAPEVQLEGALVLGDEAILTGLVRDEEVDGELRWRALTHLPADAVADLVDILVSSTVPALWWGAVRLDSLTGMERSKTLRRLVRKGALDVSDWPLHPRVAHVGARVAMALGEVPTPDAEMVLLELVMAPEARVVQAAAVALGQVGTLAALPALRQVAEGSSRTARLAARKALAGLMERLGGPGTLSLAPLSAQEGAVSVAESAGKLGLASSELSPQADEQGEHQNKET